MINGELWFKQDLKLQKHNTNVRPCLLHRYVIWDDICICTIGSVLSTFFYTMVTYAVHNTCNSLLLVSRHCRSMQLHFVLLVIFSMVTLSLLDYRYVNDNLVNVSSLRIKLDITFRWTLSIVFFKEKTVPFRRS